MWFKRKKPAQKQSTELSVKSHNPDSLIQLNQVESIAHHFAQSRLFNGVVAQSQAVVKIMAGRELGLSPFAAMQNIHFIEKHGGGGALQIGYVALLTLMERGGVHYRIVEHTNAYCKVVFQFRGQTYESDFSIERAHQALLIPVGDKAKYSPWVKTPENMLLARCVSNAAKWYFPWVYNGVSIYTEGDFDTTDNDVVVEPTWESKPQPVQSQKPTPVEPAVSERKKAYDAMQDLKAIADEKDVDLGIAYPELVTDMGNAYKDLNWTRFWDVYDVLLEKANNLRKAIQAEAV